MIPRITDPRDLGQMRTACQTGGQTLAVNVGYHGFGHAESPVSVVMPAILVARDCQIRRDFPNPITVRKLLRL